MNDKSENQAYLDRFSISNSAIQDWRKMAPKRWHDMWITKTAPRPHRPATTKGSLLDCLIFTPDDFDKRFVVSDKTKPSAKVTLIIDDVFQHLRNLNKNASVINKEKGKKVVPLKKYDLLDKELVISFCKKHDHFASKPDQAYNDVLKKDNGYLDSLVEAKGRLVIGEEEKATVLQLKNILYTNPISKPFLEPKKNCEVIFQTRLFSQYELEGFDNIEFLPVKGAIDIVHFNHKQKVVREVDLKLTEDAFLFEESVKRFDYISQHSFYDFLIREWLKTYKDGAYKDYHVANPLNLVMDDDLRIPYIYAYTANDLYIKRHGIENTKIKGWEDSIIEIAWHLDKQEWDRPREHCLNGFMNIQAFTKK